jgi:hypothetical protein
MKLTKLTTAVAALAAAAVFTTAARAQTSGDLFLGFEQSGNSSDYVVDLGQASQFADATSALTFQLSAGTNQDLNTIFGNSWASNSNGSTDVQWGVVGVDPSKLDSTVANTVWFTLAETTPGTQSTAPTLANSLLNQVAGNIQSLGFNATAANSIYNSNPTSNTSSSSTPGYIQVAGNPDSWTSYQPGVYSGSDGFGLGRSIEQPSTGSGSGPTDSVLDLYEDVPGASNGATDFLGSFSLNNSGLLTFDPNSVASTPEPSAWALGVTAVVLFLVLKRRKAIAQD